jgi:hypothetical protein
LTHQSSWPPTDAWCLDLDRRIYFAAIRFGQVLHLVVAEIPV